MRYIISIALIVVGIIHLLPLSGVLGADRLASLYGVAFEDPNAVILMRHRAVLFGLLGVYFVAAAFLPSLQISAFIAGFASVVSFLLLAWSVGQYNGSIAKVIAVDLVALAFLVVGFGFYWFGRRG